MPNKRVNDLTTVTVPTAGDKMLLDGATARSIRFDHLPLRQLMQARSLPTANTTSYNMDGQVSTTESLVQIPMPFAGTIRNFYMFLNAAPGVGQSFVWTWRKNGVDQAITLTISGTDATGHDNTHSFDFVAGDLLSIKCVASASPTTAASAFSWEVDFTKG